MQHGKCSLIGYGQLYMHAYTCTMYEGVHVDGF